MDNHNILSPQQEAQASLPDNLADKAAAYLENEYAQNTWRAYRSDFKHFTIFCEKHNLEYLPTTPDTVLAYLTTYGGELKVSVLSRRLSAIKKIHNSNGYESPTEEAKVKRLLRSIKRTYGVKQKQAKPTLKKDVKQAIQLIPKDTFKGLRDRCILLLCFIGAFRRSELVALNFDDLYYDEKGLTIYLSKSKTDQEGEGQYKVIPYNPDPEFCPVRASLDWLRETGIRSGAVFRRIRKGDHLQETRLNDKTVYLIVKEFFGDDFSAHSLRAGFVTQAKKNGAGDLEIMRQTKHKTRQMIDRYTRIESAWEHNAALKI